VEVERLDTSLISSIFFFFFFFFSELDLAPIDSCVYILERAIKFWQKQPTT
jgi:hypothetical protein